MEALRGRTVYGSFIGLLVLVRPEFCVAKLASLVVVFSNRLWFLHWFIGFGSPSSFAVAKLADGVVFFANLLWVFHRFVDFGSPSDLQEQIGRIRYDCFGAKLGREYSIYAVRRGVSAVQVHV